MHQAVCSISRLSQTRFPKLTNKKNSLATLIPQDALCAHMFVYWVKRITLAFSGKRCKHHAYSPLLVQKQPVAGNDANFSSICLCLVCSAARAAQDQSSYYFLAWRKPGCV